jgi:DNA-binding GntR family transcriptional regulator
MRGGSSDRVYNHLREMIVRGRISPGSRIVETDIALHLDVSRTPIRSALHRLQQEGYLVPIGRRKEHRLVIAPLTQEDARELFHIVGMIEGLAAAEAARATKSDRDILASELEKLNTELAQVARSDVHASQRVFEADMKFHRRYVEAGAGPRLLALHDATKPQAERYVHLYANLFGDDLSRSLEEHKVIVERIASGNPDAASRAVQRNWRNAAARMQRMITMKGERGTW